MRAVGIAAAIVTFILMGVSRADAQSSLDAARELYASAEYESALAMLDGLRTTERPKAEQQTIELYRVLCLVATGKGADADTALDALIVRNPLYKPSDDLPPRIRTTFNEKRKRLLPTAVQTAYQEAKAAYDFKDFATAERGFSGVIDLLDDPDVAALAGGSPLSDLRTLAAGFLELSKKVNGPPLPVAAAVRPQPAPVAPRAPKVYSADDTNVVPPTVVVQKIPTYPGTVRSAQTGVIEVLIDSDGSVQSATMLDPISPQYDRLALSAAKAWQYQPARLDGVPVKFIKRIQVSLVPTN